MTTATLARPEATMTPPPRPRAFSQPSATERPTPTAREYAEAWYQALREPNVEYVPRLSTLSGHSSRGLQIDEGQWRRNGGQTNCKTPIGWVDERAIGRAVYGMLESSRPDDKLYGKLLGRVITGVSISSLLREDGYWHRNRESALRYGLACLTLAVNVGDRNAEHLLAELRQELATFA